MSLILFSDILHETNFNKIIKVKCFVSGKSISPYTVPKQIKIKCNGDKDRKCKGEGGCKYHNSKIDISDNMPDLLKFIDIPETRFNGVLKNILRRDCSFLYEVLDVQNIERIFITAPTGKDRIKNVGNYVCYNTGLNIDINYVYELEGYSTVDPTTQTGTCIFFNATKLKSDVETFTLTKTIKNELNDFVVRKPNVENIYCYLVDLYTYYAHNVTKIYNRFNLHLAIDLVFKSALSFKFGKTLVNGWLDVMIIGDGRCGKGEVARNLIEYFNVGDKFSCDNLSYAGLVGGVNSYDTYKVISWGKIPMNDGGLLVIDEAGEIKPEEWTKLSSVRADGVAEIQKIIKQITNARTRKIFITNPLLKSIASYSYGIQAITEIVKAPEDVSRFDYALVVAHGEVPDSEINKEHDEVAKMHSSQLEQDLIMWIWSRKPSQIVFSDNARDLIYKKSIELSKTYSFSIPLIQGENVRIKLAKISICFAGRVYSNKENGKYLYVDTPHVECAVAFINLIYKQDSAGYYALSKLQRTIDIGANKEDLAKVEKYFNAFVNSRMKLLKCLLNNNNITVQDLMEQVYIPKETAMEVISKLIELNLIVKKYHGTYSRNSAFTSWLKKTILVEDKA